MNNTRTSWLQCLLLHASIVLLFTGCGGGGGGGGTDSGTPGTVQPLTATIIAPSGNVQITQGDAVVFQGNATGGTTPYQYMWSFSGAAPNSTAQNPGSVTFNTVGTFPIILQATDATGATSTAGITVTVTSSGTNTIPTASIVTPSANVTITVGQSVTFSGLVAGGDAPIAYLWTFGGGAANSTLLEPGSVAFSTVGTYTVTFQATDKDGDTSTATRIVTVIASLNTAIVLGANDLGMHCMDREFSVFSILPPFNVVRAQILTRNSNGLPIFLGDATATVRYNAIADAAGSINTKSVGKTNFWQYGGALFGMTLQPGQGLLGYYMPGDDPLGRGPQPMAYEAAGQSFAASGIPITPLDDALNTNTYPLLQISAVEKASGNIIGRLDVVVPVASETDCQTCHKTGGIGSTRNGITWAVDTDLEVQAKKNILKLHDASQGTSLATSMPVLCARCHYSPALDLAGTGPAGQQIGKPVFSRVMHAHHGDLTINGAPVFPPNGTADATCYQCHPGKITQCARGAMKTAGIECRDCHGGMAAVGAKSPLLAGGSIDGTNDGQARRPWKDLPRCQACHTGDAVSYLTGTNLVPDAAWPFRLRQAYRTGDNSASALLAANKRFAENANTLYRFSRGHGGVNCNGCHGSTHAEWPNATTGANDNVAATQLQGYTGKITECTTCHAAGSLSATINGPHGLHNINDSRWYNGGHDSFYENNPAGCRACHGSTLTGTPLAKATASRTFSVEGRTITVNKGSSVGCNLCHGIPN